MDSSSAASSIAPGESEDFTFSHAHDQDEHPCGVEGVILFSGVLQESTGFIHGPRRGFPGALSGRGELGKTGDVPGEDLFDLSVV